MTERVEHHWVCDRCGHEEVLVRDLSMRSPDQPEEWINMQVMRPPRATAVESPVIAGHLCEDCTNDLSWFMENRATVDRK